jgi:hypothetical protein
MQCSKRRDPVALFWAKVDKSAGPDGCWLYMGFRKWDGYGWLARKQPGGRIRYMGAHRYAWSLLHGMPEAGIHVLHKCDNPPCCNPAHLRLGTHRDNMADQKAKGRHVHGERTRKSKLTFDQVVEIRQRFKKYGARRSNSLELSQEFGVSRDVICAIGKGRNWRSSTAPAPTLHPNRVRPRRAA